ncbi:hypothetical protein SLEP1_g37009 [Rubroshorea leprosula]|uniref:Uncharacterized protein n=1 Tax=Rubroshorea leprosula TaxID=152421 RepID=A0AAV5KTT8_9ROSI|nr:hypothetical protein SLEP1_g37009 [Rubroshorea leprosula]
MYFIKFTKQNLTLESPWLSERGVVGIPFDTERRKGKMDAMRKQLDVLMGANRNGDVREVNRKYYDRDVCRLYLSGLCPHELFQLTKMDMGPCPKVHSLQLRREYPYITHNAG